MPQKIILGFVGDLAAGKGTVAKYLKEKNKVNVYRFSTMLRDILNRLYLDQSRGNMQKLSTVLRENFSQDIMSSVIAEDVKNDPNELVVVDGIRRPTDITYLKEIPSFNLIYITADSKIRWQRLVKRNENPGDDKKTFEEFSQDEQAEADKMIKDLGATAKFRINNDGSFDDLYKQIDDILEKIN